MADFDHSVEHHLIAVGGLAKGFHVGGAVHSQVGSADRRQHETTAVVMPRQNPFRSAKPPHAFQHRPPKTREGADLMPGTLVSRFTYAAHIPLLIQTLVHLEGVLVHLLGGLFRRLDGRL
jgi:hypothetical protein